MPKEGVSRREYRTRKFGSWERSLELDARRVAVGEAEGSRWSLRHSFFNTLVRNAHISWVGRSPESPKSLLIVVWFFPSAG